MAGSLATRPRGHSNTVASFAIDQTTGALTQIGSAVATPLSPNDIVISADGRFVVLSSDQGVSVYSIDLVTGSLSVVPGSPFNAGVLAFKLAVEPSNRFIYQPGSKA